MIAKTTDKMMKAAHRQALIDAGFYGRFKEKTIADKTKYKRKAKHKNNKGE
jgi:hypothetical protein